MDSKNPKIHIKKRAKRLSMNQREQKLFKEYVYAEAAELVEKAGFEDLSLPDLPGDLDKAKRTEYLNKVIQKIIAAVHNVKNSDDKKAPIISLNNKQIFASIQLLEMTCCWHLIELDPDDDFLKIMNTLDIIDICKKFISQYQDIVKLMALGSQNSVVNIPLVIPDVNKKGKK